MSYFVLWIGPRGTKHGFSKCSYVVFGAADRIGLNDFANGFLSIISMHARRARVL
jgi:hypothetical protein